MGLLDASAGSGGSVNTAKSWSNVNGSGATASSNIQAATANASAYQNWLQAAEYNAEQARIQREWQERMANTVYQRSIADMKKAGINPILAANMGLGTASVGSGATASLNSPATFMGQSFADQNSASESYGSSWNQSESGLATFLNSMGTWVNGMIGALNSSKTIQIAIDGLKDFEEKNSEQKNHISDRLSEMLNKISNGKYGKPRTSGTEGKGGFSSGGTKF